MNLVKKIVDTLLSEESDADDAAYWSKIGEIASGAIDKLKERGIEASWEHPGYISVRVDVDGRPADLAIGTDSVRPDRDPMWLSTPMTDATPTDSGGEDLSSRLEKELDEFHSKLWNTPAEEVTSDELARAISGLCSDIERSS